jgi:hypothetical protein
VLVHLLTASACPHVDSPLVCPVCEVRGPQARQTPEVDAARLATWLRQTRDVGASRATLRDGDLLTRPEALELLELTQQLAFNAVEVWTSGLALVRPESVARVREAGATHVAVPLYGDSAEAHDLVTAHEGHFQRVIRGLRTARAAGLRTTVLAPVLRPTFRQLPRLVAGALSLGASAVRFSLAETDDREAHPLLPHPGLAAPFVRAAVRQARTAGLRATTAGIPPCLLEDLATTAWRPPPWTVDARATGVAGEVQGPAAAPPGQHGRPCQTCTWRDLCAGVAPPVVARHGWGWVVPRDDAPPARKDAVE